MPAGDDICTDIPLNPVTAMPLWKSFHCPTQDSRDIIAAACRALNHVWREGYRYMKAGVMLADFTPSGIAQPGLFDEIQPRKKQ